MVDFFQQNWQTLLLGLISAGLLAACRYIWKQMKKYKQLIDEKEMISTEELIDEKLGPIYEDLEELRGFVLNMESAEKRSIALIVSSYKYRLVQLCKLYIKQGYMTQMQYDQLSEFYRLYTDLGGNGQAKEYYEKTIELPIHD